MLLRLLVVQHLDTWSSQETVERVADSLGLRWCCRVSFRRGPDKATLLRWAQTIRPATLQALLERAAVLAKQAPVIRARQLRIERTCVQTPLHHPTDRGLVGDGVRVLTRLIQRAKPLVGDQLGGVRDAFRRRLRTVRRLLQQVHRVRRVQGDEAAAQQRGRDQRLLATARQTRRQAERVRDALRTPAPAAASVRATGRLLDQVDRFLPLVARGIRQAQRRVLAGQPVPSTAKVLSRFEPHTGVVTRGKRGAAVEFGRQVVLDEVEGGIVTRLAVLADDQRETRQVLPALQQHPAVFGRPACLVTGDRRRPTKGVEDTAHGLGVPHVVLPRAGTLSAAPRARARQRAWKRRYRWRAGIEGRMHSLRRDDGLARGRSHGLVGLERDVGWGVLASNLRHLAAAQVRHQRPAAQRAA